jgi:hypothetical protein
MHQVFSPPEGSYACGPVILHFPAEDFHEDLKKCPFSDIDLSLILLLFGTVDINMLESWEKLLLVFLPKAFNFEIEGVIKMVLLTQ